MDTTIDVRKHRLLHSNGSVRAEFVLDPNDHIQGVFKSWYENGQQERISQYLDNALHGETLHWHESGQLLHHYFNKQDGLHGNHKSWHLNGVLASDFNYRENRTHGVCIAWDELGRLTRKITYKDGVLDGMFEDYDYNKYNSCHRQQMVYVDGTIDGEVKLWINDNLVHHYILKDGKSHGESKTRSDDGKQVLAHHFFRNGGDITEQAMRYIDNEVMFELAINVPRLSVDS